MKHYQSKIAALLLCVLLLAGCGKAAEAGGSAENSAPETEQSTKKNDKKTNPEASAKPDASAAPSAASTPQYKAAASASPAPTAASKDKAAPTPTPDPVQEATDVKQKEDSTWSDVEKAQQDVLDNLAVSPTGNWIDRTTGMSVVIDDVGNVTVLWVQSDGTAYCWTCTITQDDAGVMHYSDCIKLSQSGNNPPSTLYQNGTGTMTIKNGNLYWQDDIENIAANLTFESEG